MVGDPGPFPLGQVDRHRHRDAAGAEHGVEGGDEGDAGGQLDRDPFAGLQAVVEEAARLGVDGGVELGPGGRHVGAGFGERQAVGGLVGRAGDQVSDVAWGVGHCEILPIGCSFRHAVWHAPLASYGCLYRVSSSYTNLLPTSQ
ncbi:hypothetical protein GCM10029964_116800 [Kibdelosporangium lantanae]